MSLARIALKRATSVVAVVSMVAVGLTVGIVTAPLAAADPAPLGQRTAAMATADVLPTVQIDGVVWAQAVVGNTVFAGGQFANARPAGAAAGTNLTPRANFLSYNLATGALNTSFAPSTNGPVQAVAVSPDKKTVYIGGTFTQANGQNRYRLAAYDVATGALSPTFKPILSYQAKAIAVSNTAVYVGGTFTTANGVARSNLAAFSPVDGSLLSWAPSADAVVNGLVLTPDGSRLIAGGSFQNVNGSPAYGLAAIDANTGALLPWAANNTVRNAGANAGIFSLTTDGTSILGTGWVFGAGGNLEGTFSADPNTGTIKWVEDCHGDTYGAYSDGTTVYTVSHAHYCSTVNGFFQSDPWSVNQRHALAFSAAATGTLGHNIYGGYKDWAGTPSPTLYNWFADPAFGNYTSQGQAAWNVTGSGDYVVMGGEFPSVSGVAQQGLVRFAKPNVAPKKERPRLSGPNFLPTLVALPDGRVRVSWQSNWDRDDLTLTYKVYRNNSTTPIYTTTADATFWNRPNLGFIDSGLTPGATYDYKVSAFDADGNVGAGSNASIVAPAAGSQSPYAVRVAADGASPYWRMDEASGTTLIDSNGFVDGTTGTGVTRGAAGAIINDTDTATTFNGTINGTANSPTAIQGPNTFSLEAWIKTTSTTGGKIIGFGSNPTGNSGSYDRHVYLDNSGKVYFGVYPGTARTVNSTKSVNDGKWHHVVASMGPAGMALYVDGVLAGNRSDTTAGQAYTGYWRVGGDNLSSWPGTHTSNYIAGAIDEVAIYDKVLTAGQVAAHFTAGTTTANQSPVAAFTSSGAGLTPTFDGSGSVDPDGTVASYSWNFGDNTVAGSGVGPSHTYAAAGTYQVTLTVTDNNGATGTVTHPVTVAPVNQPPVAAFTSTNAALTTTFDGSGSVDPDGTVASYSWNFGDNTVAGSGVGPSHTYATAGTYQVTLTVTDNNGATGTVTHAVTVAAANQPPSASFTTSTSGLTASLNAAASSDPDGSIASYAWDFGDGQPTGSGVTTSHSYAAAGTYTVTLTVTDNQNATATTTRSVTVTTGFASDLFGRTVANGWGSADQGGAWAVSGTGGAANFSVTPGTGKLRMPSAGATDAATLSGVSQTAADVQVAFTSDLPATGGGIFFTTTVRRVGNTFYSAKALEGSTGKVTLYLARTVSGTETVLTTAVATGITYTPGMVLRVRFQAIGSGTTTLNAKIWQDGQTEPSSWLTTTSDTTAALQAPGAVGVIGYLSGTANNAPVTWLVTSFTATTPAP